MPLIGVNLRGDGQADRTVHGRPDKAVYAYATEDTELWEAELGVSQWSVIEIGGGWRYGE